MATGRITDFLYLVFRDTKNKSNKYKRRSNSIFLFRQFCLPHLTFLFSLPTLITEDMWLKRRCQEVAFQTKQAAPGGQSAASAGREHLGTQAGHSFPGPPPGSLCEASRWGQLRGSVVSELLTSPPGQGHQSPPFPKGGQKTQEALSLPDHREPGSSGALQTLPPGRPSTASVTSSHLKSPSHSSINLLCSYGNTFILEEWFPSASPARPAHRL